MMEITINVPGLEKLADAVSSLALGKASATTNTVSGMSTGTATVAPSPIPGATTQPVMPTASVPVVPANPIMPSTPVPTQVPTSAVPQEYTQDQIAVAMTGLSDQGRSADLINILAQFGVSSLVQVPKERYPELVLRLREAGAAI